MSLRNMSILVLMIAALWCVACDGDETPANQPDGDVTDGDTETDAEQPLPFDDPEQPGSYGMGAMDITVTYEDPDVPGRMRELPCVVWYPARETGEIYYYDGWYPAENVYDSVAPDTSGAPYPVVAFSHGNSGMHVQSWTMMEYLVSHGFVVGSCNHVGNTAADWNMYGKAAVPQSIHDRPYDVRALIDHLLAMGGDGKKLAGMMDDSRIAASGHSLGGCTTLAVAGAGLGITAFKTWCTDHQDYEFCSYLTEYDTSMIKDGIVGDPRVKAAVAYAPASYQFFTHDGGLGKLTIPMMIMGADRDGTCPVDTESRPIYGELGSEHKALVIVNNAAHMSFSNMCDLIGGVNEYLREEGCGDDFDDPQDIFHSINHYTLAFLRRYLDDDSRYDRYLNADDPADYDLNATVEDVQ